MWCCTHGVQYARRLVLGAVVAHTRREEQMYDTVRLHYTFDDDGIERIRRRQAPRTDAHVDDAH